jgi:Leucine-rich repeat (LRR) protein
MVQAIGHGEGTVFLSVAPLRELSLETSRLPVVRLRSGETECVAFTIDGDGIISMPALGRYWTEEGDEDAIRFADMAFEAMVRDALNRPDETLTLYQLAGVTALGNVDSHGNRAFGPFTTLSDLRYLPGLTELHLHHADTALDLSPIAELPRLGTLSLQNFRVQNEDLAHFRGLPLRVLLLDNNPLTNIAQIAHLPLYSLSLGGCGIRDIAPVARLNRLTSLDISGNAIENLSPLSGLQELERLSLAGNPANDVRPLSRLSSLWYLDLSGVPIADFQPLSQLTQLRILQMDGCGIHDIGFLAGLTALETLNLSDNNIESLEPLAGHPSLTVLRAENNQIADVSVLAGCPVLTAVFAAGNPLTEKLLPEGIALWE